MEQIDYGMIEVDNPIHKFYCDMCKKFIGESEEDDDGYYEELGTYEQSFLIGHWYKLNMCLCKDCREKKNKEIITTIKSLGFKWDTSYSVDGEEIDPY